MPDLNHPQYQRDRELLNRLQQELAKDPTSERLMVEVARLRIRYAGFPGARDIQSDLDACLAKWNWTEEELFTRTREIHQRQDIYPESFSEREDWP